MNSIAITYKLSLLDRILYGILGCFGSPDIPVPPSPPAPPPVPEKTAIEIGDAKEKTAKRKKTRLSLRTGILGGLSLPGTDSVGTETK